MRGSLDVVSLMHNPQLADPVQARGFMDRQSRPSEIGGRYDWIFGKPLRLGSRAPDLY